MHSASHRLPVRLLGERLPEPSSPITVTLWHNYGEQMKDTMDTLVDEFNIIKAHNKRIYMKLNVSSRKELLLYVQMIEEQKK